MSKFTSPVDYDGEPLGIGNYVKYDNKTWEIVDYEDSEEPATDDNYDENCILLLACRSHDHENIWVPDYDVQITEYKQSYFEL